MQWAPPAGRYTLGRFEIIYSRRRVEYEADAAAREPTPSKEGSAIYMLSRLSLSLSAPAVIGHIGRSLASRITFRRFHELIMPTYAMTPAGQVLPERAAAHADI